MTAIEEFVLNKMSGYIIGGMAPATAARFTAGELESIYRGRHRGRDESGAWRQTTPPESVHPTAARTKWETAIAEILKCAEGEGKGGQAPETTPRAGVKKSGLEGMKNYVKRETA